MLKPDAVPTKFSYNNNQLPKKRSASERRLSVSLKKKQITDAMKQETFIDDVLTDAEPAERTTETQIDACTQTEPNETCEIGIQAGDIQEMYLSDAECENSDSYDTEESSSEENHDADTSFIDDESDDSEAQIPIHVSQKMFIVFWSCLVELLKHCLICHASALVENVKVCGSALSVTLYCTNGHRTVWRSQPFCSRYYEGNVKLAACVLFSSNTYMRLSKFFNLAGIPWVSKTSYYKLHKKYLIGVTNEAWLRETHRIMEC